MVLLLVDVTTGAFKYELVVPMETFYKKRKEIVMRIMYGELKLKCSAVRHDSIGTRMIKVFYT